VLARAAKTLVEVLDGGSGRDGTRLAAARSILEHVGLLGRWAGGAQETPDTPIYEERARRIRQIYGTDDAGE